MTGVVLKGKLDAGKYIAFAHVAAALCGAASSAAFAQTEYTDKDFYRHGASATPFVKIDGMEPGMYILAIDHVASTNGAEPRYKGCYLNGIRIPVWRSCPPNGRDNEPGCEWIEFKSASFKNGDILSFQTPADVPRKLKFVKKPLPYDVYNLFDEDTKNEIRIADLDTSSLTPTSLTVRVKGLMGRKIDECTLDVHAYDYWQNDLVRESFKPSVDGTWERTWTFPASVSGETRAIVRYSLPNGKYVRKFLNATSDVTAGLRRRMVLDGFKRTDLEKDEKGRAIRSVFEKTVVVPRWLREGRVLFAAERVMDVGKVYVNGKEVGEQTMSNAGLPCEYDITDALSADGTAEIRLELEHRRRRAYPCLADAEIRMAPAVRLPLRPVITTKLEGRTLRIETPQVPEGCVVSHRVLRRGREVLGRFGDGNTLSWPDVELWGPLEFPLYELETTLSRDGVVLDRLSTRFGFREFSARGMDYLWNGRPFRGIDRTGGMCFADHGNGWTGADEGMQRFLDTLETCTHDDARFIRYNCNVDACFDWCDEIGLLTDGKSPMFEGGQMSTALAEDDELWRNMPLVVARMIDVYRHHPAINVWGLCGEFWAHHDDRTYQKIKPSFEVVHAKDPSRDAVAGSDMDFRGMNKHSDTHYPAEEQLTRDDLYLPDSLLWRPIDKPFTPGCKVPFGQQKNIGNCMQTSPLVWGVKPITCQEAGWSTNIRRPHGSTQLFRDTSYGGFNTMDGHHAKFNYLLFLGHRDAGVTMIGAWRAAGLDNQARSVPLLDVWLIERYHAFYEGTEVRYQVDLFHDVLKAENMDFSWRLERVSDGKTVARGRRTHAFDFCEYKRDAIAFEAPKAGRYRIVYSFGPVEKSMSVETYAKRGDEGSLLSGESIVGPDDPIDSSLLERIRSGERVLILPRKEYPSVFPVPLKNSSHVASIGWTFRADDPVLAGIDESDLSFWYPNHAVGHDFFEKPVSGCAKTIAEAGGRNGLVYSGLVEFPMGKGAVYATRLDLDPEVNPLAAKMLRNIRGQLGRRPLSGGRLGVVGDRFFKVLKGWGVDCALLSADELAKAGKGAYAAFFVDGADAKAAEAVRSAGVPVIVQDPDAKIWNVTRRPNKYSARQGSAMRLVEKHPLLRGLTNFDFFWRKLGLGHAGENPGAVLWPELMVDAVGTDEIFGADEDLLFPRFLVQRGSLYFSTLNMNATSFIGAPLCERVWTTMLANLGVKVVPGVRVERPESLVERPLALARPTVLSSRYTQGPNRIALPADGARCGWFVLRHAAKWTVETLPACKVSVTFEDGTKSETEFVGGVNVRDLDDPADAPFTKERMSATRALGKATATPFGEGTVYETAWPNDTPDKRISAVEVMSAGHGAVAVMGFSLADESKGGAETQGAKDGDKALCDRLAAEGARLQKEKKFREAIAIYEKAHAAAPRELYVMNALGNCHQALDEQKAAEQWYLKSLRTDLNQPPVWDWLKSTGSTASLDESGSRRGAAGVPTLSILAVLFSTDGGNTWTKDPPILSGDARKFQVKAEWTGADARRPSAKVDCIVESSDGGEKTKHVGADGSYWVAYRELSNHHLPYVFDMDFANRAPGTYKYRFRLWYRLKEPDPSIPGPDKCLVETSQSFSVFIK